MLHLASYTSRLTMKQLWKGWWIADGEWSDNDYKAKLATAGVQTA